MDVQADLKEARKSSDKTLAQCAGAIDCTIEGYRLKELGRIPISGGELARLADLYGKPLRALFPSYTPSDGEAALARHLGTAA